MGLIIQLIGAHDLLIAATARHRQSAVLTTNADEFVRVPDLEVLPFRDSLVGRA